MAPPKDPRLELEHSSHDADLLEGDVPDDDAPPSPAELAHAASFAALLDKAEHGRIPPALSADERALLEVATVLRAATGRVELSEAAHRAAVEHALAAAVEPPRRKVARPSDRTSDRTSERTSERTSARPETARSAGARLTRQGPTQRWLPWTLAGTTALAAAAAITLWLRPPRTLVVQAVPRALPAHWTSRPADAVVGEIARESAGAAASRIDAIYSDRLEGYRAVTMFAPGGEP